MKRMHIHIGVKDLEASMAFYTHLFGVGPTKIKSDYAKWMLEDPFINFAISTRSGHVGLDHLGIQADDEGGLSEIRERLKAADVSTFDDGETTCCYAKSEKSWVQDPSNLPWEAYVTMDDADVFSEASPDVDETNACCLPSDVSDGSGKSSV